MIFKGLTDKFKRISGSKFLKQELIKRLEIRPKRTGAKRVGIIIDLDKFSNPEKFEDLRRLLNLDPNAIHLIGYRKNPAKDNALSSSIFSDRDLGWNGVVENNNAFEFLDREYDLLLNYYNENNLMMQLLSQKLQFLCFQGHMHQYCMCLTLQIERLVILWCLYYSNLYWFYTV